MFPECFNFLHIEPILSQITIIIDNSEQYEKNIKNKTFSFHLNSNKSKCTQITLCHCIH